MRNKIFIFACVLIASLFLAVLINHNKTIYIGDSRFTYIIVDDNEERVTGLSDRDSLAKDSVMLFVFDETDYHGIWMKDMKFPIDIIWLDEQKKAVDFKQNATPESYPESFQPKSPAKYVVETNSGAVQSTGLQIGDEVEFTLP